MPSSWHCCSSFRSIDISVVSNLKAFCLTHLLLFIYAPSFVDWYRFSEGNFQWLSTQSNFINSVAVLTYWGDWLSYISCRHSILSSLLLEQRSLEQAAEVFILLSSNTERRITALRASWRKITVWILEMTQRPAASCPSVALQKWGMSYLAFGDQWPRVKTSQCQRAAERQRTAKCGSKMIYFMTLSALQNLCLLVVLRRWWLRI